MDRVVGHREVADANTHTVVVPDIECVYPGKYTAIPRPQVEVEHGHHFGGGAAGVDIKTRQQNTKVAVDSGDVVVLARMCYPGAHHAHCHLCHLITVRVIHKGTRPSGGEFVDIGLARRDRWLVKTGYTIHTIWQALSVPVNTGVFRQSIGHKDSDLVTFHYLNSGAW